MSPRRCAPDSATSFPSTSIRSSSTSAKLCTRNIRTAIARVTVRGVPPRQPPYAVRASTDDWPFLYIRPRTFPTGYVAVLGGVLLIALIATRAVYGRAMFTRGGFDPALFLMGAAF